MDNNIKIIMRQTNYTEEDVKIKLKQHNNNVLKIIEEYMEYKLEEPKQKTVNQTIYSEIRELMSHQNLKINK